MKRYLYLFSVSSITSVLLFFAIPTFANAQILGQQNDHSSDTQISFAANVPDYHVTAVATGSINYVAFGVLTSQIADLIAYNPDALDVSIRNLTTSSASKDVTIFNSGACVSFDVQGAYTFFNCPMPSSLSVSTGDTIDVQWIDQGGVFPYGADVAAAAGAVNTYASGAKGSSATNPDHPYIVLSTTPITVPSPFGAAAGLQRLIASSTSQYESAFQMTLPSITVVMAGFMIEIIGAGFGVLQQLMPYIIGLVVISAIVYFLYRAFRFFKH